MNDPWQKLNDGYLSEAKPDKKSLESRILAMLKSHPNCNSEGIAVRVTLKHFNSCSVKISGNINRNLAMACVYMVIPSHFEVDLQVD